MKSLLFSAAIVMGTAAGIIGVQSEHDSPRLHLILQMESASFGPLRPLQARLAIKNVGNAPIRLPTFALHQSFFDRTNTVVECRPPGSNKWTRLAVLYLQRSSIDDFFVRGPLSWTIPPGKSQAGKPQLGESSSALLTIGTRYLLVPPKPGVEHPLPKPGEYRLRAEFHPRNGPVVRSKVVRFRIVPYQGIDLEAYRWLLTRRALSFMYGPLWSSGASLFAKNVRQDAHTILKRFPNSRFSPWAKLFLARIAYWDSVVEYRQNQVDPLPSHLKKAEILLARAEKLAHEAEREQPNDAALKRVIKKLFVDVQQQRRGRAYDRKVKQPQPPKQPPRTAPPGSLAQGPQPSAPALTAAPVSAGVVTATSEAAPADSSDASQVAGHNSRRWPWYTALAGVLLAATAVVLVTRRRHQQPGDRRHQSNEANQTSQQGTTQ